jgi:hypothetical protein
MEQEKRVRPDRRQTSTKPFGRYMLRGRRMKSRRRSEDRNYYVDRYETGYFALICAVLLFCVLDAYLTLRILHIGGNELNPLMRFLLERKPGLAMTIKYLGLAASIVVILVHKNFTVIGRLKAHYLLFAVLIIYGCLVAYEAYVVLTYARLAGPLAPDI